MFHRYQHTVIVTAFAAILLCVFASDAWACPTCKSALEEGSSHIVNGYFWSIIFMMSMPFTIVTALSIYFYVLVLRARAAARKQATKTVPAAYSNRVSASTLAEILEQPREEVSPPVEAPPVEAPQEERELVEV